MFKTPVGKHVVLNACCAGTNVTVRAPLQASMHSDTYHKLQFVIGGDAVAPTTVVARDQGVSHRFLSLFATTDTSRYTCYGAFFALLHFYHTWKLLLILTQTVLDRSCMETHFKWH